MLEYIILGRLMKRETSGYDLKRWMANSTSNFFDASFGSIYPALKRLEAKRLIVSHEEVAGGKLKKLYAINDGGKEAFMNWLAAPIDFAKTKHDHLVKIYFYDMLPKERAKENLEDLVRQVEPHLSYLLSNRTRFENKYGVDRYFFQYSSINYGIDFYRFVIDWANDVISKL